VPNPPPDSFAKAAFEVLWPSRPIARVAFVIIVALVAGAFAVWVSLPDASKEAVLRRLGATATSSPAKEAQAEASPVRRPPATTEPGSTKGDESQRSMEFYLQRDTVIPGPLLAQHKFDDGAYNSCMQECEANEKCMAWVFGPDPLPQGVRYNCGLKFAVTGPRKTQLGTTSGYSTRYVVRGK
jgi:hypothetical protein